MHATLDPFFLRVACNVARTQSDDPHTQNGAVLVAERGENVAAANTLPPDVQHRAERLERPMKYNYIEHAERNVIYTAARLGIPTKRATLYCPWFACTDCARAIIIAGIHEVVGLAYPEAHGSWKESIERADEMLREAGIICRRITDKVGVKLLRDGKEIEL
ncbi:MAG: CMP deaminase [Betaproteobacteria bacterium]|nr:CMP deaminase [Betaproteobacteria bacterium]